MPLAERMLAAILNARIDRACRRKLRGLRRHVALPPRDPRAERRYRDLWSPLGGKPDPVYLRLYQGVSGIASFAYVPENLYYKAVEPALNHRALALAYADKNVCRRYLPGREQALPETFLRGIGGVFHSTDSRPLTDAGDALAELPLNTPLILKPSVDSSGGSAVAEVVRGEDGRVRVNGAGMPPEAFVTLLRTRFAAGFVLQEKIRQHPWFQELNPSSVNTVRMVTFRSPADEAAHVLKAVVRFGRPGSLVDNQAAGGRAAGVTPQGQVQDFSVDKRGVREPLAKTDRSVPAYDAMADLARRAATGFPYHRLLGFDLCVDAQGAVKLLEINTRNLEINFLQMNLGPLFEEFTEEVAAFCARSRRSYVLDFEV